MVVPLKRRLGLRIFGGGVLLLLLLLVALRLWIVAVAERKQKEAGTRIADLSARLPSPFFRRPPLREGLLPGNAWDDYERALKELQSLGMAWDPSLMAYVYHATVNRTALEALATRARSAYGMYRTGAMKNEGCPSKESPRDLPDYPYGAIDSLLGIALFEAQRLAENGRTLEAAESYLDLLVFAWECMIDPTGWVFVDRVLDEIHTLVTSGPFRQEELRALDRQLNRVVNAIPPPQAYLVFQVVRLGKNLLREPPGRVEWAWDHWNYGFSKSIAEVDFFLRIMDSLPEAEACLSKPWKDERSELNGLHEKLRSSSDPSRRDILGHLIMGSHGSRLRRTQLELLRAAIRMQTTGEFAVSPDPFGTTLLYARDPKCFRAWSVGSNGKDDGGIGRFGRLPLATAQPLDIVVEVDAAFIPRK